MQNGKPTYEELEVRLHKLEAEIRECQRQSLSNRYAAAIMHEVNNPLEAMTNLAYLVEQEELSPVARERMDLLQQQISLLVAVTRPSLAFYREQKAARQVDLTLLIDSVNKLHATRAQSAGIKLHRRCPDTVLCDAIGSELLQVLSNLVLNSIEALSQASQGAHIHIRVRRCTGCIRLLVADDGPGIPKHLVHKVFQAHTTGKPQGSGLGLWISERIIQNHSGSIRVRTSSRPGRSGTAFQIYLPCTTAA